MNARLILTLIIVCSLLSSASTVAFSQSASAQDADSYVLEQGDRCQPIEPIESGETVESFYDYRNHETHPPEVERLYSSYGTTHLQEDDTSILFLHEGPDGLSLVMVNDHLGGDTRGGLASLNVTGVPSATEWVVQDDLYTGESNMAEWHRGDGWIAADWIWSDGRTDGGAIRGGLDDEFAITVHPGFNENATFADPDEDFYDPNFHDGGGISDWEYLSGDSDSPDRTDLDLEEPVTLRTGTCDDPFVTTSPTETGSEARILNADPDNAVSIRPQTESNGVRFERLDVTGIDGDATLVFDTQRPDGIESSPDGGDALSHLSVTSESRATDVSGTATFTVDAATLNDYGLEPDAVALYERSDDGWTEAPTTLQDESDETYRFTADVTSLSAVSVAERSESGYSAAVFGIGAMVALASVLGIGWLWSSVRGRGHR
ncbi:hypothetical protein ACFO5R_08385 [Halosolutus amylolyticus]|uniref:PGF-pre-PGF domain-containing protein n=1 Tax=Halosolutus amylolyticus TaxID=2932267 RepID=A0ABD5PNL5_9EURY|nr:hypothetical protein [Halosolutus amylolyticus]